MTYKFICPKCGCNRIEQVISGATVTALVEDVDTVESVIVYGRAHVEDFDDQDAVCYYGCNACSHAVAMGDDQLIRVLKAEKLAREQGLLRYSVTIEGGEDAGEERYYWAEDLEHAREQAVNEFPDDGTGFVTELCKGQE